MRITICWPGKREYWVEQAEAGVEAKGRAFGRVRQADIARAAGVSQATVSLVLRDDEDSGVRVSEATRRRILDVARELGYSVNPAARNLAGGRNRLLGVYTFEAVFPSGDRDFYYPFLLGIEHEAERAGYDLLLFTSASMPGQRRSIYAGGTNRLALADGSILLGRQDDKAEVARLVRDRFPFVYIGRREVAGCELSYVTADYTVATDRVISHLVELGHRHIVYLGVPEPREPDLDREQGWVHAVRELRLSSAEAVLLRPPGDRPLTTLLRDLHRDRHMSALVIEDPEAAPTVFDAVTRAGLRAPHDVSVAVLGDIPSTAGPAESWTGFRIPREEMGRQAVRLLLEALESPGGPPRQIVVACDFAAGGTASVFDPVAASASSRSRTRRKSTVDGTEPAR
jgi:DNA-binding LacI/PurR family transcriptional regulator